MESPKYQVGEEVRLVGMIRSVKCLHLSRGWQYQVFIEGISLEDMQFNRLPEIVERGINLDKIPDKV